MAKITISGVAPFDGDYDLDDARAFNGHELHLIKKVAGVRLGEIGEALKAGDYDLIVAVTAIAVWRAGKVTKDNVTDLVDVLLDADTGQIEFRGETEEEADSPPEVAPRNEPDSLGADNESSGHSFEGSNNTGADPREIIPIATGLHG